MKKIFLVLAVMTLSVGAMAKDIHSTLRTLNCELSLKTENGQTVELAGTLTDRSIHMFEGKVDLGVEFSSELILSGANKSQLHAVNAMGLDADPMMERDKKLGQYDLGTFMSVMNNDGLDICKADQKCFVLLQSDKSQKKSKTKQYRLGILNDTTVVGGGFLNCN